MVFKKLKEYGQAYAGALKQAYDPERLRDEMTRHENLKYAMPNASPERLPELVGLVPGAPMAVEDARAWRHRVLDRYRAPGGPTGAAPVPTIDRVFTRQPSADEIVTVLSRTSLDGRSVLGVYPSTDLLHPARFGSGETWWEWCVVHTAGPEGSAELAAAAARPPTEPPAGPIVQCTEMARFERWIDRDRNDPILFDEEAAAIVAVQSGVDPAQCLGLHRMLDWGTFGIDPNRMVGVMPVGARILRRAVVDRAATADPAPGGGSRLSAAGREWFERQHAAAGGATGPGAPAGAGADAGAAPGAPLGELGAEPVEFAYGDPLPVHMDLLDWTAISLAVQPIWTTPPRGSTTLPQLPDRPEELLLAYLTIVGLDPADTFGLAATVFEQQSAFLPPDAAMAERGQCASMLAVVYRDRPAYAEGRARFEQYRAEQLGVPLTIERPQVGRVMALAMKGMKWHLRSSVGDDLYEEIGGEDSVDGDLYPYIVGPPPRRR